MIKRFHRRHDVAAKRSGILLGFQSHQVAQRSTPPSWSARSRHGQRLARFLGMGKRESVPAKRQFSRRTTSTQSQPAIPTSSHALIHRLLMAVAPLHGPTKLRSAAIPPALWEFQT